VYAGIRECVVTVREDGPMADKRLVAYLVRDTEQTLTVRDLRSYLQDHLPAYMIPSAFVFLDALPLMPHGKLDRRALPAPEEDRDDKSGMQVVPRTVMEGLLLGIFCEVLGLHRDNASRLSVGMEENFFELGGHSLLAIRLVARVRTVFNV